MQEENGKGKPRFEVPSRDCDAVVCGEWQTWKSCGKWERRGGSLRPERWGAQDPQFPAAWA